MLKFNTFEIDESRIAPKGIAYLLQYGLNQSMQDSIAGLRKKVLENVKEYRDDIEDGSAMTDDEVAAAVIEAKLTERFNAIVAGTVGTAGGGTRLTGEAKLTRDVAMERLKAIAVSRKVTLPKEAEKINALIDKHLSKPENAEAVKAEVARRMAAQKALAESSDDDLKLD